MAYTEVPAHGYGGLRVDIPADEVGLSGAIDALDVELDRPGVVRSRDGTSQIGSDFSALSNGDWPVSFFPWGTAGFVSTMRGAGTASISDVGSVSASRTSGAGWSSVPFGTPTATRAYIGETANLVRLESTTFTALGYPTGLNLAVTPNDNRLVLANVTEAGPTIYNSRVRFSDAGAPETFGANNYVDLDPGNGESISAMAAWNGFLFVFKGSRVYVFFGNSTDATGEPVFNYRRIETGIGCVNSGGQNCVCAAPDGLYFVGADSLYRTTGGPPEKFASPLDVLVKKADDPSLGRFFSSTVDPSFSPNGTLSYASGYLFVTTPATTNADRCTFAYHFATGTWTFWGLSAGLFCQVPSGSGNMNRLSTPFLKTGSSAKPGLWRKFPGFTTDGGTAISSRYRTGFYDLGENVEKRTRGASVWGTGSVNYQSSRDFGGLDTPTALTLSSTRTNLVTNPSFETNTTSWAQNVATGSLTRTASATAYSGAFVGRQVNPGTNPIEGAITSSITVTPSSTYTAGAWVRTTSGTMTLTFELQELTSGDVFVAATTTSFTATTDWQFVSATRTLGGTGAHARVAVKSVGTQAGTYDIDAVQLEAGSTFRGYFDGSFPPAAWTGTAHASTSTLNQIGRGIANHPKDGTLISHQFSDVAGAAWTVHRHSIEMEPIRSPGTKTP